MISCKSTKESSSPSHSLILHSLSTSLSLLFILKSFSLYVQFSIFFLLSFDIYKQRENFTSLYSLHFIIYFIIRYWHEFSLKVLTIVLSYFDFEYLQLYLVMIDTMNANC